MGEEIYKVKCVKTQHITTKMKIFTVHISHIDGSETYDFEQHKVLYKIDKYIDRPDLHIHTRHL